MNQQGGWYELFRQWFWALVEVPSFVIPFIAPKMKALVGRLQHPKCNLRKSIGNISWSSQFLYHVHPPKDLDSGRLHWSSHGFNRPWKNPLMWHPHGSLSTNCLLTSSALQGKLDLFTLTVGWIRIQDQISCRLLSIFARDVRGSQNCSNMWQQPVMLPFIHQQHGRIRYPYSCMRRWSGFRGLGIG